MIHKRTPETDLDNDVVVLQDAEDPNLLYTHVHAAAAQSKDLLTSGSGKIFTGTSPNNSKLAQNYLVSSNEQLEQGEPSSLYKSPHQRDR